MKQEGTSNKNYELDVSTDRPLISTFADQNMNIDYLNACYEYLQEENVNGFKADSCIERDIAAYDLRSKGQEHVKSELYDFITREHGLREIMSAIEALGRSYDPKYIPLYEQKMKENLDDNNLCHACLIAIDNAKPIGLSSISCLEGSKNAKKYFGMV